MAKDSEIAKHLDLSTRSVRDLRDMGRLPAAGADLADCRVAYFRYLRELAEQRPAPGLSELDRQRARLAHNHADGLEMRNAAERRTLVPAAPVLAGLTHMIELTRSRLLRVARDVGGSDTALRHRVKLALEDAMLELTPDAGTAALERIGR